jgi:AcrR family transcriptional regulator
MVDMSTSDFAPWGRSHILDTAGQLFRAYGIHDVSMTEIADACNIDEIELNAQFESKEELLQVYIAQLQVSLSASFSMFRTSENAIDAILKSLPVIMKIVEEVDHEFLLELETDYPEIWRKMEALRDGVVLDIILANLNRGRAEGLFRDEIDPVLTAVQRHHDLLDLHSRTPQHFEDELHSMTIDYLENLVNANGREVLAGFDIKQFA